MINYIHPLYCDGAIEVHADGNEFAIALFAWCVGLPKEVRVFPDGNGDLHYYIVKCICV